MPNIQEKTKYQETQKQVEQSYKQFDRNSIWYSDRPISARTQVANRYLDWVVAYNASIEIPDSTQTNITWYTYTKTGRYDFNAWNTDRIIIPQDWTYQVIANFRWLDTMTIWWMVYWITLNWNDLYWWSPASTSSFETIQYVWIENLTRWDYIQANVFQTEWWSKDITVKISVVKLS
jgi:hypothetical protein